MDGCLYDGILFCMQAAAQFMAFTGGDAHLFAQAADIKAMLNSGGSTVVAGSNYAFFPDKNGAYMAPQTGGTLGHQFSNAHEIFFPGRAGYFFHDCIVIVLFATPQAEGYPG